MLSKDTFPKVLVTGTKGKTSIVHLISTILRSTRNNILRVDTGGSYLNEKQITSYDDSVRNFGKSPNVRPGRYLYWHLKNLPSNEINTFMTVLEGALSCSHEGTGLEEYGGHDIGILSNIFRDHINFETIKNEDDIYDRKSFVFKQICSNGLFITTLDNKYNLRALNESTLQEKSIRKIAISIDIKPEQVHETMHKYNLEDILYLDNGEAKSERKGKIFKLTDYPYYLDGFGTAMLTNALIASAACLEYLNPKTIEEVLTSYRIPKEYGRMLVYKRGEQHIVLDYAHEIESLKIVTETFRKYYKKDPYIITRVASDRKDGFLKEFADKLSLLENIKGLTIYDRIDGINSKMYRVGKLKREIGESSGLIYKRLKNNNPLYPIKWILNEQDALSDACANDQKLIILIHSNLDKSIKLLEQNGFVRDK